MKDVTNAGGFALPPALIGPVGIESWNSNIFARGDKSALIGPVGIERRPDRRRSRRYAAL